MTKTNPVDPEVRKSVSGGVARAEEDYQIQVKACSPGGGHYLKLKPEGMVPPHVINDLGKIGWHVSAVSATGDFTLVMLKKA